MPVATVFASLHLTAWLVRNHVIFVFSNLTIALVLTPPESLVWGLFFEKREGRGMPTQGT